MAKESVKLSLILPILKVPKCATFDLLDFNDFYVMKSLKVGGFMDEIKKQHKN
jgi:hypothetical protein